MSTVSRVARWVRSAYREAESDGVHTLVRRVRASIMWHVGSDQRAVRAVEKDNRLFDERYGTRTAGEIPLTQLAVDAADAARGNGVYRATPKALFDEAMGMVDADLSQYTFVDYGSGMGKVLLLAAAYPFRAVIGIEYSSAMHAIALDNIQKYERHLSLRHVTAACVDATEFLPPSTPLVCFFFNPFDRETWRRVLRTLESAWRNDVRPITVVYVNIRNVNEVGDLFAEFRFLSEERRTRNVLVMSTRRAQEGRENS